ncbi:MAG: ABC transporter permease [Actinomycetota bacterium]|nr:ABC transporter permease [Actinomycetota bacterium]
MALTAAQRSWLPPRTGVILERNIITYRRQWIAFATGFFEPVFYLLSIGIGVGALVGRIPLGDGRTVAYAEFVAPAMLATSAMNGAVYDATYNMFFKLRYARTFESMLATPIGVADIAAGELAWTLTRGGLYSLGFLAFAVVLGLVVSWWALLAVPVALLIGFAFGAVGMAATTWIRGIADFDYVQLGLIPMMLLSATFFPADTYPGLTRWLVELSPLYHGVALERGLMLGQVGWDLLAHLTVLLALGAAGLKVLSRRLAALLLR